MNRLLVFVLVLSGVFATEHPGYWRKREKLIQREKDAAIGGRMQLTALEKQVDAIFLRLKREELNSSFLNTTLYPPAWEFHNVKNRMEKSELFELIKWLPKGSSLHTHLTASVSFDYVMQNLTRLKDLYVCTDKGKMHFFSPGKQDDYCQWQLLQDIRKSNSSIDAWLAEKLSINVNTRKVYHNNLDTWQKFLTLFRMYNGLISYIPVTNEYVYQALTELYEDNVFYAEFRSNFWPEYDLNISYGEGEKFIEVFIGIVERFKAKHPGFVGAKLIFTPSRSLNKEDFDTTLNNFLKLQSKYPAYIAGFDLVGFEDLGVPLKVRVDRLIPVRNRTKFFFHAGETNWYGFDVDENLVDAVLLGAKRLGHAYALLKHPQVLKRVRKERIALEISPISNQVLWLVDDLRNHPAVAFAAMGLPIVICNDDPGLWGAKGLSYDWYLAFMAFSNKNMGLQFLKQLALNSIHHSVMSEEEKRYALAMFDRKWIDFLRIVYEKKMQ